MSEQTNISAKETPISAAKTGRRKWWIGGAAAIVAVAGLGAASAVHADGGWGGHHGGRGHHWGRTMDPERMGKRVDFGVDMMLGRVGADAAQKTKVSGIIKGILGQAPEFRKGHEAARDQLLTLLKADKFDKDAVEKLRAERIKAMDEASKKVVAALDEVVATLSDKQRKELVELAEKRRSMFGGRGHRRGQDYGHGHGQGNGGDDNRK